ncbi:sugar ABC transporter ATP-binding protein [Acidisoma cellulosilytica]|uniref:Sugar ABC transporter ATP-binding protein n=1 Tax=Acidisoma cellulosilyticum TaxID=2802395 RepID=A0A964E4V3_9PROT|nr:sugar ABC transporter ATP-binding protein [Acidisoma cellulosilyticum]MCB8881328.1 sugar ABC transporter ATP-binding protein [Acidisoma cellulosilyticum]
MTASVQGPDAVRMTGIMKSFGGIRALDGVDLSVAPGSIHALLGENGAGKSTILKILRGVQVPDAGEIHVAGVPMTQYTPEAARNLGVAMIFQEMSLIPTLTVAQNIFLTREPRAGRFLLDDRSANNLAKLLLQQLGLDIDPRTPTDRLSTGEKQMTEIAKAISQHARVLIMDEPTSALSTAEVERLFAFLRGIKDQGVAVIYVSHKMDEIQQIADTVTILRDGRHIITKPLAELTLESIIEHIVGRRVNAFAWKSRQVDRSQAPLMQVRNLSGLQKPSGISFDLYPGEILGIAGLMGAGRSELARAICGIDKMAEGEVRVQGKVVNTSSPRAAIRAGIALIPEDRRTQGLILEHSVLSNLSLPTIDSLSSAGFVDDRRAKTVAEGLVSRLRVKLGSLTSPVRLLSGGNQQKVVLGKWLAADPIILILDEPTAGVDIGSKAEIVELIRSLADAGRAIIMISSELAELLSVSDRILVMHGGRITRDISRDEIDGWAENDANAVDRISQMEHGLQLAIQGGQGLV